ncbi:MAG: hypothetical protein LBV27_09800 [Oscillospiraceae bacterium]|jgi:uncharacterized membrane protein|nr:hypothetical protein [Oscillospiraceae bacterium]
MYDQNNVPVFETDDIQKNKNMAAIAYLIFFIPLIACPNSAYGRFHANQGLLLFITGVVGNAILRMIPIVKWFMPTLFSLCIIALGLYGLINTINGKAFRLPVIGGFTILN